MSKRLPPLNALRVFDAAARHLSFTRAAEELFVTQAAVSHQIKSLEDFLGLKLFRRRNRSLLLTEEGQSYFLDIKEIFSQLTEATRKLQARSAKGALTVSLLPSFAIHWLVPRLSSFNSAYPGIDVRIQAVDRQEDKLADDVDVAIFYGRGNCAWLLIRVGYQKRKNPLKNSMWQLIFIMIGAILWDYATGWIGWSVDFAIPLAVLMNGATMQILARAYKMEVSEYLFYLMQSGAAGIVPAILWLTGTVRITWPSVICVGLSVLYLIGLFFFRGKDFMREMQKKFRV